MTSRREVLKGFAVAPGAARLSLQAPARIRHVDIIHHSHTDVGYTDLPSITRDSQVRFLSAALDACLNHPSFRWTAEALLTVNDWWRTASPERREQLVRTVRTGRMDVMALPFNQTPFQNAMQWDQMFRWIPDTLWKELRPEAAMQNDVNGFPRAGAIRLLDRGISRLLLGINPDSGGAPFQRPTAFWWKMPDGRRMFVWLGEHYGVAYSYFEPKGWIRGQPKMANATMGPPRAGQVLRTDEASLRAAHAHCIERLRRHEQAGYGFERLIISYTNQWRYDNDAPFPALADFVDAWNRLGLTPPLRLATATEAVREMERAVGSRIPVHEGEWTDWWANGDASGPREVAASRFAKRAIAAANSPVWGEPDAAVRRKTEQVLRDLCLFNEHTWGANVSISQPDSLETIGQFAEKSLLAHRPKGHAEVLLAERARTKFAEAGEGVFVTNTARAPYSGWVRMPAAALRVEAKSVVDEGGQRIALAKDGADVRFWMEKLGGLSTVRLRFTADTAEEKHWTGETACPTLDAQGWPTAVRWGDMKRPLFTAGTGDFLSARLEPPDRGLVNRIYGTADLAKREQMRAAAVRTEAATADRAEARETAHTLVYTQAFRHPSLANATRTVEIYKRAPRATFTFRFDRVSSLNPEVFYIQFALPAEGVMPVLSGGGVPFVPYRDQLEGTCRDYFAFDGWAHHGAPEGHWLWVSRDAPLVTIGGPHTLTRHQTPPADTHRLLAMVFDNFWHTNFVANSHGRMEFQFELAWQPELPDPGVLAEALVAEPVVVINPVERETPEIQKNLFRP